MRARRTVALADRYCESGRVSRVVRARRTRRGAASRARGPGRRLARASSPSRRVVLCPYVVRKGALGAECVDVNCRYAGGVSYLLCVVRKDANCLFTEAVELYYVP